MSAPYTRKRAFGVDRPSQFTLDQTDRTSGGAPVLTHNVYSGKMGGRSEVMLDTVTPEWKAIVSKGGIINNAMSRVKEDLNYSNCAMFGVNTHPTDIAGLYTEVMLGPYGSIVDLYAGDTSLTGNLPNLVREQPLTFKAASDARSRINPLAVQGIVAAVELPKTIDLIRSTALSLGKLIRGIKTGNLSLVGEAIGGQQLRSGSAGRFLKQSAYNRWLEYRYGWRPLIMDLQGALKALDKSRSRPIRATARGKAEQTMNRTFNQSITYPITGSETYEFNTTHSTEVRAYCLYTAELTYQSARDFGVTELPLAFWELVPYSFVADWFIPIGNWLEAITPKLGIVILAEGYTVKNFRFVTRRCIATSPATSGTTRILRSGQVGLTDTYEKSSAVRVPSLDKPLTLPPFSLNLNVKRALDAIALLGQSSRGQLRL